MQNKPSMEEMMRMASSPAGQQLLQMLKQSGGQELDQAMLQASAGDYRAAKTMLQSLMRSPQAQALFKQMGGSHGTAGR